MSTDRKRAIDLADRYGLDKEKLADYLIENWLSGSQALEAINDYLTDELEIQHPDEDEDEDDEELDDSVAKLEEDLWKQPTGAPPVKRGFVNLSSMETYTGNEGKDFTKQPKSNFAIDTRTQDQKDLDSMRNGEGI